VPSWVSTLLPRVAGITIGRLRDEARFREWFCDRRKNRLQGGPLTTVYTLGDLVAGNSTTSASAVQLSFVTANGSAVTIADATPSVRRCKIKKTPRRSGCPRSVCTCSRATWRPRLAIVNGDGAVYIVRDGAAVYIGPPNV
jgi:hypothetical protein